jgi:hypothetical protein
MPRSFLRGGFLVATLVGSAQAVTISDFDGIWLHDKSRSADVPAAVEQCVAKTNFVVRGIARPRLLKTNVPYDRISIVANSAEVKVVYGASGKPVVSAPDGKSVPWKREDGEVFQLSHELKGDRLVEIFQGEDGGKQESFGVSADRSTLTVDVKVTSPKLPEPLVYRLVYRRKE